MFSMGWWRHRIENRLFSILWWRWNLVANQILKNGMFSDKQLNILVKEQINFTRPFYDEISKYSQSILANIPITKQWKMHRKFRKNLRRQFRSYKCKKNTKQRRKTFTLNTLSWLRHVFKTIRPVYASILLF
jgi:hypothetical protein